jgi:hypothetical protein
MDVLAAVTVHLIFAFMLTRRESGRSLAATLPFCVNNFKCPVLRSQSHIYIYIEEIKLAPFLKNFSLLLKCVSNLSSTLSACFLRVPETQ